MVSGQSKKVLYVGLLANLAIAACKYLAAILSRSSAMLAEAVHSTIDTGNELLLILGMKRSARPPDRLHPYGYGKAIYFYSLLVAVYIFGLGGGFSVYRGIARIRHPEMPTHAAWNYAVLTVAGVLEFLAWRVSFRELRSRKDPDESVVDEIVGSKDPTVFTVFLEDSAGLIGTLLAFMGVFFGTQFRTPYLDPAASILIGILLAGVAIVLGRETGALLLGERTNRAKIRNLQKIISSDPAVEHVGDLLTMQLGPQQALLTVLVRFQRGLDVQDLELAIERIRSRVRLQEPTIEKIFIEANPLSSDLKPESKAA